MLKFIWRERDRELRTPYSKHQFSHQAMRVKNIGATQIL